MSLDNLENREKKILLVGAIVVGLMIVYLVIDTGGPSGAPGGVTKAQAVRARDQFVDDLARYEELAGTVEKVDANLQRTPPGYDLSGSLNKTVEDLGLLDAIKGTKQTESGAEFYSETYVDMNLQKIKIEDLVNLLKRVEALPVFVKVTQLSVKRRFSEEGELDVSIRVSAFAPPAEKAVE